MSYYFPSSEELGRHTIFPGVKIRTAAADKMLVAVVDLASHSVVAEHAHPHEQVGMILEGQVIFFIGDEQKTLQAGDLYRIPGNTKHKVIALEESVKALDIFYPVREEYR